MTETEIVEQLLSNTTSIEFAVLVGSRAIGTAKQTSDWDIAVQWQRETDYMHHLATIENLRNDIAKALNVTSEQIDLIDIPSAKLAMRELIANEGIVLSGDQNLAWIHFLHRTWREIEDYYWDELYVA